MTEQPGLSAVVGAAAAHRGLHARDDIHEAGWTFWELRNLNMHRVVGLIDEPRTFADVGDLEHEIRAAVARHFTRAWWRGLAFGVVARVEPTSWRPEDLEPVVDIRERRAAVLQWIVLVNPDGHSAVGVHTWEQVYLSPVYQETLTALTTSGYQVATAVKGKDGLLRFLTDLSEWRGVSFPEFHDRP